MRDRPWTRECYRDCKSVDVRKIEPSMTFLGSVALYGVMN